MKNKVILGFLPIAVTMIMLTGCGKGQDVQEDLSGDASETATQNETVNLVLWGAEEEQEMLATMIENFKAEYASEATINIELAVQSESQCKDAVLADVEGAADVFAFVDDQLRTFVAAGAISPVIEADTVASENIEGAVEAASVNGTLFAYPMTADNGYFLYYNKAYFSEDDVKSLDKILEIAKKNNKKVVMDWTSGWYLYSFFGGTGLEVGLNEDGVTNYCNWNATDTAIKGVDVAEAMLKIASNPGFVNADDAVLQEGAEKDQVIAGVSGVWSATALSKAWGNNLGATKLPTYTCAGEQVQMSSFTGYKMVGVNAYSEHEEWAHKLAQWITNETNQTYRFEQRAQGPSNKKAAESDAIAASPAIQAVIMQSEYGVLQRIGSSYWDPVAELGTALATRSVKQEELQNLLDKIVANITVGIGM